MSRLLILLPLFALLVACSKSDTVEVAPLSVEEASLAQYLADSRLDNGAYDRKLAPTELLDKSRSGYQNLTGIAALGLIDAHERDTERVLPGIADELTATKNYIYGQLARYARDSSATLSATNLMFMARYKELFGLSTQEWQMTLDCLQKRLEELDGSHGTDESVLVDGWVNHTVELRDNQDVASVVGWDLAFILRALVALDAPQAEIDYLTARLLLLDYDADAKFGVLSAAHALFALETVGDSTRREELVRIVRGAMDDNGKVGIDTQLSAYALMGLRAAGSEDADLVDSYLRSKIDEMGYILESDGNIYFEVVSEVISALLR